MSMFVRFVLLFTTLLSSVLTLPLVPRDVVDPPITSPTSGTTWHVGEKQTVTWSTSGLPVNQTNPVGRLVLGYLYNNSENLMLDSPLATNLNYSTGQAQITVPNVPTRSDYIVVLFGDSGNASPEFTIINDTSNPTSAPSPQNPPPTGSSDSPLPPASAPASDQPPSSPGGSPSTPTSGSPVKGALPTPTAPSSSHTSTVVTVAASSSPSAAQSNAAWQKQAPNVGTSLSVALAFIYFIFS